MGLSPIDQDKCVYKCTPIEGQPQIDVGLYVDNLIYYSLSDIVKKWFKTTSNLISRSISRVTHHVPLLDNNINGIMMSKEEYLAKFPNKQ